MVKDRGDGGHFTLNQTHIADWKANPFEHVFPIVYGEVQFLNLAPQVFTWVTFFVP